MNQFEMFSEAKFIKSAEGSMSPRFRGKFTAVKGEKAEITVCGLGFFRLYVNGKRTDDSVFAPVTSFYHHYEGCHCEKELGEELACRVYCLKYDISDMLVDGENVVCAEVGPGWYFDYKGECTLCYKIEIADRVILSDESVKVNDGPLTSFRFTKGEKQDFMKPCLDDNWINPDFDDSGWQNAVEYAMPETEYYIQDCPNDRVIRTVKPLLIGETENTLIYDVGENISGSYVFTCDKENAKISVVVSEELDSEGKPHEDWNQEQTAEFITDGKEREYRLLFTWHAFRYFEISKGAKVTGVDIIHCDAPVTSSFKCENEVLNWLYDAFIRTQLCNMHAGIPSDCPHLERRGYTGDGQLTCEAVMMMIETEKFYRKWMEDIADCQDRKSGNVQYTAPYMHSGGGPGGWGCAISEVPYIFYKHFGDIKPAERYFDGMLRYIDYLENHSENDLVTSGQPNLWCLGEWCSPQLVHGTRPDIPEPFVNTYFYIRMIDRICEIAEVLGKSEIRTELVFLRKRKVKALYDNYFDEATGDFAQNLNSADAFALEIGIGDERTLLNLVEKVRTQPLDTGIFGTELVAKILFKNGYFDEAVEFLSRTEYPSYGFMMKSGATTLWEEWKNPRSMSHPMFGSAVKFLFAYILGIRQQKGSAGYKKLIIEPKTNEVTGSAEGYFNIPAGRVSVKIDREKNECFISVPDGVEYEVIFDGKVNII